MARSKSPGDVVTRIISTLKPVWDIILEVSLFWWMRLIAWFWSKSPTEQLLDSLQDARLFEEWEAAAYQLDEVLGYDLWRANATSAHYDYRLINERLLAIIQAREDDDIMGLVALLRSGLVRNLGNITSHELFGARAYGGTKVLIDEYVTAVALAIEYVTAYPTLAEYQGGLSDQGKLDTLHDTRQAFGRSALVLQGGSIFGLCHIGVVKALHLRGLLPRIITGTATGALIAALVGVHTEDELLNFLTPEGLDLSAFVRKAETVNPGASTNGYNFEDEHWLTTTIRRLKRFAKEGHLLDVTVLEECVKANVGDMTFEEAYRKTKRILNITVPTSKAGVPMLLNYLTAPHVLVWSAALASNVSTGNYQSITLLCKDEHGQTAPWPNIKDSSYGHGKPSRHPERDSPLARLGELFNVNHFIVSQARPYLAPFLRSDFHTAPPRRLRTTWSGAALPLARLVMLELQHRLAQLDALGLLPAAVHRFLLDEAVSGASLLLVPDLSVGDFVRLLENPSARGMQHWILKGERSVWPTVAALRTRCAIEVELDRGYQMVRRRKPFDLATPRPGGGGGGGAGQLSRRGSGTAGAPVAAAVRRRSRAGSFGAGVLGEQSQSQSQSQPQPQSQQQQQQQQG